MGLELETSFSDELVTEFKLQFQIHIFTSVGLEIIRIVSSASDWLERGLKPGTFRSRVRRSNH